MRERDDGERENGGVLAASVGALAVSTQEGGRYASDDRNADQVGWKTLVRSDPQHGRHRSLFFLHVCVYLLNWT